MRQNFLVVRVKNFAIPKGTYIVAGIAKRDPQPGCSLESPGSFYKYRGPGLGHGGVRRGVRGCYGVM